MDSNDRKFAAAAEMTDEELGLPPQATYTTFHKWLTDPEHERLRLKMEQAELRRQWVGDLSRYGGQHLLEPYAEKAAIDEENRARGQLLKWYATHPQPDDDGIPTERV